jgi:Rps23 Pro-64 3,4-dihydroxylase Tpa1-like proline 4-hydroxylase
MPVADRRSIADRILERLEGERRRIAAQYASAPLRHFIVDELLPPDLARAIYEAFPAPGEMMLRSTIRERKYVSSQMNKHQPLVEEAVFAWHDPRVLALMGEVTGLAALESDERLYAAGVSVMGRGHFLSPHLDNSHDMEGRRYRVLNTLHYVSPGWTAARGGSLELWPDGPRGEPLAIPALFNRLIVIATNRASWHSVDTILEDAPRTCVSNYYFSRLSPEAADYFHNTSFRGRPGEPVRDLLLRADTALRSAARRALGRSVTRHYYHKDG